MKNNSNNSDWTENFFQKQPDLFLDSLKERIPQAEEEVGNLVNYLKEQGFAPKRILDLNCGIGRHSIELAKRGFKVYGTDLSEKYIQIARDRAKEEGVEDKTHFRVADMRKIEETLSNEEPFDGVINLWTSFGYYDNKTNESILRKCNNLVKSDGFFLIDIINRDWLISNFQERGFSEIGDSFLIEERSFDFENSRAKNKWTYLIKNKGESYSKKVVTIDHRVWSLHELIDLFERNRWKFKETYFGLGESEDESLLKSKNITAIFSKK